MAGVHRATNATAPLERRVAQAGRCAPHSRHAVRERRICTDTNASGGTRTSQPDSRNRVNPSAAAWSRTASSSLLLRRRHRSGRDAAARGVRQPEAEGRSRRAEARRDRLVERGTSAHTERLPRPTAVRRLRMALRIETRRRPRAGSSSMSVPGSAQPRQDQELRPQAPTRGRNQSGYRNGDPRAGRSAARERHRLPR